VCISECSFFSKDKLGCSLDLEDDIRSDALLFGESQSRIIVSVRPDKADEIQKIARDLEIPLSRIGRTGGKNLTIRHQNKSILDFPIKEAFESWKQAIPDKFRIK
jgi:phosphoribosylformylglycinamidine synthase